MRIAGERSDGAKLVHIGGGLAIVLRGAQKSRPLDLDRTDRLGPWSEADNSLPARRVTEKAIASARVDLALDQPVHLGDTPGHPFRGNQYGEGEGRASMNPGGKNQHGGPYHGSPGAVAAGKATHEALRHAVGPVAAIEQARKDADAAQSGTATEEQHARLAKFHEGQAHVIATQPHAPMDATARHTRAADAHQAFASKPGAPEFKGHPDELDEAAADAAGRYWASPEGQAIKAQGHSFPRPGDYQSKVGPVAMPNVGGTGAKIDPKFAVGKPPTQQAGRVNVSEPSFEQSRPWQKYSPKESVAEFAKRTGRPESDLKREAIRYHDEDIRADMERRRMARGQFNPGPSDYSPALPKYKPNPADTPAVGTRGSVYDRKTQRTQGQAIRAAKRREKGAPWR